MAGDIVSVFRLEGLDHSNQTMNMLLSMIRVLVPWLSCIFTGSSQPLWLFLIFIYFSGHVALDSNMWRTFLP